MKKLFLYLSAARRYLLALAALALVTATASLCYLRESVSLAGTPATGDWDGDNDVDDAADFAKAYDEIWHDAHGGPTGRDANPTTGCDWRDYYYTIMHSNEREHWILGDGDNDGTIEDEEVEEVWNQLRGHYGESITHTQHTWPGSGFPLPLDLNGDEECGLPDQIMWGLWAQQQLQENGYYDPIYPWSNPAADPVITDDDGGGQGPHLDPSTSPYAAKPIFIEWAPSPGGPMGDDDEDGIPNYRDNIDTNGLRAVLEAEQRPTFKLLDSDFDHEPDYVTWPPALTNITPTLEELANPKPELPPDWVPKYPPPIPNRWRYDIYSSEGYDFDFDGYLTVADVYIFIKCGLLTAAGDSDFDRDYDSDDIIVQYQTGLYEENVGAFWWEGDFDLNGVFDSDDYVYAASYGLPYESERGEGSSMDPQELMEYLQLFGLEE